MDIDKKVEEFFGKNPIFEFDYSYLEPEFRGWNPKNTWHSKNSLYFDCIFGTKDMELWLDIDIEESFDYIDFEKNNHEFNCNFTKSKSLLVVDGEEHPLDDITEKTKTLIIEHLNNSFHEQ